MTKSEFLQKLKTELASGMKASDIQEQLNYYGQYIDEEVGQGKDEAEVISELGDPWVIAKTILDSSGNEEVVGSESKWKFLFIIFGLIGIIMLLVAVVGGIISLLAPVLVPVLVIALVIRIMNNRRR